MICGISGYSFDPFNERVEPKALKVHLRVNMMSHQPHAESPQETAWTNDGLFRGDQEHMVHLIVRGRFSEGSQNLAN